MALSLKRSRMAASLSVMSGDGMFIRAARNLRKVVVKCRDKVANEVLESLAFLAVVRAAQWELASIPILQIIISIQYEGGVNDWGGKHIEKVLSQGGLLQVCAAGVLGPSCSKQMDPKEPDDAQRKREYHPDEPGRCLDDENDENQQINHQNDHARRASDDEGGDRIGDRTERARTSKAERCGEEGSESGGDADHDAVRCDVG